MRNNIFRLHNLKTNAFNGQVNGNIAVNLLTMFLDIDVKGKNVDDKSVAMMRKIQRDYNVETTSMIHIHCHLHGKGEFVLHGFVIRNCFEIVWFDPSHELHK